LGEKGIDDASRLGRAENAQRLLATVHPTVKHHVVEIADVIEVVVRQQDRIDAIKRNAGLGHLHDHATASITQDIVVADADESGRGSTPWVRPWTAGS